MNPEAPESSSDTPEPIVPPAPTPPVPTPSVSGPDASDEMMPATWPGAFGVYKFSRRAVLLNLGTIIWLWVINILVGIIRNPHRGNPGLSVVLFIIGLFIGLLISVAYILVYLAGTEGKRISLSDSLSESWPFLLRYIGLILLVFFSVAISLVLLVVPGIIILPRLLSAPYFLVDQKLGVVAAYKASWHATKGHARKVWGILGVSLLMILPVFTIIGIIATVYLLVMYGAASALLYRNITASSQSPA